MHHDSVKQSIRAESDSTKLIVFKERRNRERIQESSVGSAFNDISRITKCPSAINVTWTETEICIRIRKIPECCTENAGNLKKSAKGLEWCEVFHLRKGGRTDDSISAKHKKKLA